MYLNVLLLLINWENFKVRKFKKKCKKKRKKKKRKKRESEKESILATSNQQPPSQKAVHTLPNNLAEACFFSFLLFFFLNIVYRTVPLDQDMDMFAKCSWSNC